MTVHEVFADSEIHQRFYDRLRERIHSFVARNRFAEKIADFLLLVPDVFILLWRLTSDARVKGKDKVLLGTAIAYYIFPFDLVPEAIVGPKVPPGGNPVVSSGKTEVTTVPDVNAAPHVGHPVASAGAEEPHCWQTVDIGTRGYLTSLCCHG